MDKPGSVRNREQWGSAPTRGSLAFIAALFSLLVLYVLVKQQGGEVQPLAVAVQVLL